MHGAKEMSQFIVGTVGHFINILFARSLKTHSLDIAIAYRTLQEVTKMNADEDLGLRVDLDPLFKK